jgi:hypothetical protein
MKYLRLKQEIQVNSIDEWVQHHVRLLKQPNDLEHGKSLFAIAQYIYQQNDHLFMETGIEAK